MEGKVVLVTGSSSGIGEATALAFAKLDCHLVIHGTNMDKIKRVAEKCEQLSPSHHKPLNIIADFRNEIEVEGLYYAVINYHKRLDVLVNNAGLYKSFKIGSSNSYELSKEMMQINFNSVVQLTSLCVAELKKTRGCIVNISSNLAFQPFESTFGYSAAKAALTMFTKCMAVELAPHVRVNSISPGPVATQMPARLSMDIDKFRQVVGKDSLVGRVGESEEIARAVIFMATPEAGFITGSDLVIDGGISLNTAGEIMGDSS